MTYTSQLAKHFRDVHFGGNWTTVNLKETLADVTWQEAVTKIYSLNTIAALAFHIHYYVDVVLKVLQGGPLDGSDKLSFNAPPVHSQQDWENQLATMWADAEEFATMVEELPESRLQETFSNEKYGNYFRNLHGIIEHTHYHLGQIVVIKKFIRESNAG